MYCYTLLETPSAANGFTLPIQCCPFWKTLPKHPNQSNGWCGHLQTGDMVEGGTDLLWDQVKACDVNCELPADYNQFVQS
jgi:hypothetical protein